MAWRPQSGSVLCPSCGKLVGVRDERCFHCGRRNPGLWGLGPFLARLGRDLGFTQIVLWACGILYVVALLLDPGGVRTSGFLELLAPSQKSLFLLGESGAYPVFGYGRWWTVLSAGWLHGGLLHIAFNLLWVRQLAPAAVTLYGVGRTAILYTVAGAVGFALSSTAALVPFLPRFLAGAGFTVGASAPVFGLLAALVHWGRRTGGHPLGQQAWTWAVALFIMGFLFPGVDNWGHLGGFAGGYLASFALDPLQPERLRHLIWGLVCLLASAAAIAASVLHGLSLVR